MRKAEPVLAVKPEKHSGRCRVTVHSVLRNTLCDAQIGGILLRIALAAQGAGFFLRFCVYYVANMYG